MFHCKPKSDHLSETEKRSMPVAEIAPSCPRCASLNTKFCYYNNYSLSQPRFFCKGCRRYWTEGGSLRNVPFGGGCRKNRRSKSSAKLRSNAALSHGSNELAETSTRSDSRPGPDIDLAVVFANFLNQNPTRVSPDSAREQVSDGANKDTVASLSGISSNTFSAQNDEEPFEAIGIEEFRCDVGNDGFLCDASSAASFSWQSTAQFNEIEAFSSSLNDNIWSSFDFSGFGVFSTS